MAKVSDKDLAAGFATRAIHAGQRPDESTGAIMPPVYLTSTYVQPKLGEHKGFEYSRTRNPTRDALERNIAALEGATNGLAFASGMAATDAVLSLFDARSHIICGENVYGGTHRIMTQIFQRRGFEFTFVDSRDLDKIDDAITFHTKLVYVETPSNPMMHLTDLAALAELVRDRGLTLVVDNTFATPYFQKPIELGAEVVIHSTTKYINGHSDVVGGVVVTTRGDLAERMAFFQNAAGAVPGPMDCWLTLRGVKTLPVRMRQHDASGREIAAWLSDHPAIHHVFYPGLPDHPQYELACRQMSGFGGMITVDTGSFEKARALVENTRIFSLAESLGGVESLIGHPATMTHAGVPQAMRNEMGLSDGMVRLSVGIEDTEDLIRDLERALHAAASA
jgi:cystathionine beta-lyase/cystathionine gamma-synthase